MSTFVLEAVGAWGTVRMLRASTFPDALSCAVALANRYPEAAVLAFDVDGAADAFDGLTDSARNSIAEAVGAARRAALERKGDRA